jgi:hypothetical protein
VKAIAALAGCAIACGGSKTDGAPSTAAKAPAVPTFPFEVAPPTDKIVDLGRSPSFACVVRASGGVDCWGRLGLGRPEPRPRRIPGVTDAVAITDDASCVLRATGQVACLASDRIELVTLEGLDGVAKLGAGEKGCYVMRDGGVTCTETDDTDPQRVPEISDAIDVSPGGLGRACVVRRGGAVVCGDQPGYREPLRMVPLLGLGPVRLFEFARDSTDNEGCAVLESGELRCFEIQIGETNATIVDEDTKRLVGDGKQLAGATELAIEDLPYGQSRPFTVEALVGGKVVRSTTEGIAVLPDLTDAVQLAGGCALRAQGSVVCWGSNGGGALGQPTTIGRFVRPPSPVVGIADVEKLALGADDAWALTGKGHLYHWGKHGGGWATRVTVPGEAGNKLTALAATEHGSACVLGDRGVFCWKAHTQSFQRVAGPGARAIVASGRSVDVLQADDNVVEIGIDPKQSPYDGDPETRLPAPPGTVALFREAHHLCVINPRGEVHCWIKNSWLQIPSVTGAFDVAPSYGGCALRSGSVACWRFPYEGAIIEPENAPTVVDAFDIARSGDTMCFAHAGGKVSCVIDHSDAMFDVLPGDAAAIELGAGFGCAILRDRTVTCWGDNNAGELGDGSLASSPKPLGVPGL